MSYTYRTLKYLTNNEKNIETHFAHEDGDSNYGHMDATHLDIIIFFAKPNGSIDHLIGYESVKKISYWYLRLYEEQMFLALVIMMRMCVLLIVQQLIQFSGVIIFSLEGSERAIILLPRSWIETY